MVFENKFCALFPDHESWGLERDVRSMSYASRKGQEPT
jgi:hypothetical protein